MSVTATIHVLTKEQYENDPDHKNYEDYFRSGGGNGVCFSNVVHEGYPIIWHSPRTWSFEEFLRPLPWGQAFKVSKQQLLEMVPKAIEYSKENLEDAEDLKFFVDSFEELVSNLIEFDEDTHTLIITSC